MEEKVEVLAIEDVSMFGLGIVVVGVGVDVGVVWRVVWNMGVVST